jgi:hypothetical protein
MRRALKEHFKGVKLLQGSEVGELFEWRILATTTQAVGCFLCGVFSVYVCVRSFECEFVCVVGLCLSAHSSFFLLLLLPLLVGWWGNPFI